ncbi:MAG: SpoVA/SpoVAEb family sporulation membrane protein [Clostridia bacterium]|nr:SpoVA/SpoVAEb family sporulation membrane protein [Clostridia bacterium]
MNFLFAFLIGGAICAVGQLLLDFTKLTPARILTGYVVTGVLLEGIGLFAPLRELAGAGATVPLCGFGSLLARGVREAVGADGLSGILTGGLTACAAGITAAILAALLSSLLFSSKEK